MGNDGLEIDRTKCNLCGNCVKKCLFEALSISGKIMTAEEVFKVVNRDKDYYDNEGGCTCSGGEILSQADFVAAVFRICRENGIHTNADTSGFGSREALKKIMEYADMFYYDFKILNSYLHKQYTGVGNEVILDNLRYVAESGIPLVIRVPLIPGVNASDEDINNMAKTIVSYAPNSLVSMLSYHEYGKNKYRMIGREYPMPDTPSMTEDEKARALEIVSSYGLQCKIS